MKVKWEKCKSGGWCDFQRVNLGHAHFNGLEGVYVIWHGGDDARTVRVGQGSIRDRLTEHRDEPGILKYQTHGLSVTWAVVPKGRRDGVERFLAETLGPLEGERFPDISAVAVNLPR